MKLYPMMIGMFVAVLLSGCSESPDKESKSDKPKTEQTAQNEDIKQSPKKESQTEEQSKEKETRNEEQSSK
jgi:PBP1b-binding outer membrane lipoprotein LpoB